MERKWAQWNRPYIKAVGRFVLLLLAVGMERKWAQWNGPYIKAVGWFVLLLLAVGCRTILRGTILDLPQIRWGRTDHRTR